MLPTSPHKYLRSLTASSHSPRLAHQPSSNLEQRPSRNSRTIAIRAISSWLHTSPTTTRRLRGRGHEQKDTKRHHILTTFLPSSPACLSHSDVAWPSSNTEPISRITTRAGLLTHNSQRGLTCTYGTTWTIYLQHHSRLVAASPDQQARLDTS